LAAPGGFAGVDVFFVISGFLIDQIVDAKIGAGQFSFLAFYARRARRILPALMLLLHRVLPEARLGVLILLPLAVTASS